MSYKNEWVDCPVCGCPDMRKEIVDEEGNALIHCVNHACLSNGGSYQEFPKQELCDEWGHWVHSPECSHSHCSKCGQCASPGSCEIKLKALTTIKPIVALGSTLNPTELLALNALIKAHNEEKTDDSRHDRR